MHMEYSKILHQTEISIEKYGPGFVAIKTKELDKYLYPGSARDFRRPRPKEKQEARGPPASGVRRQIEIVVIKLGTCTGLPV